MILHEFPDLHWLKEQIKNQFAAQRAWDGRRLPSPAWPNVIINASVKKIYRDDIKGPLSVFLNLSGESHVTIDKRKFKLVPGSFVVSNTEQLYTLELDNSIPTETFNIHFGEAFSKKAMATFTQTPEQYLEQAECNHEPAFHNRLQLTSPEINSLVRALKNCQEELQQVELMFRLFGKLQYEEGALYNMQSKIPALKKSSREEIMKRLLLSTDYIHAYYDAPLALDELAEISHLSKFHYLRSFSAAFGATPYQFISNLRIQKGQQLLANSELPVQDVALKTGFADASSFSRAFHRKTGTYPSQFRTRKETF